ncbi:MAG: MarR family winged helix-turn-helix transcriptional regulator [Gemmatimonadales bacterium]
MVRYPPEGDHPPLALLLCRVGLAIKAAVERRVAGHGLSYIRYQLLVALADVAGMYPREAARQLGWSRQVMAVAARDLSRRGLIRVERRPPDRRLVRLRLTEAGETLLAALRPPLDKLEAVIGRRVYPLRAPHLAAALERLTRATPLAVSRERLWESEFR